MRHVKCFGKYPVCSKGRASVSAIGRIGGESLRFAKACQPAPWPQRGLVSPVDGSLAFLFCRPAVGSRGQGYEKPAGRPITIAAMALPANRPRLIHAGGLSPAF